jgi:hypothetical protein
MGRGFQHILLPVHWTRCVVLYSQELYFTAHHHAAKKQVAPGELYVAKSPTTAFVALLTTSSVIDSKVLIEWRAPSLYFHEWNKKLFITTNALDEEPASTAAMEVQENLFRTKALNFKTPAKRKQSQDDGASPALSLLDVSAYSLSSRRMKSHPSQGSDTSQEF